MTAQAAPWESGVVCPDRTVGHRMLSGFTQSDGSCSDPSPDFGGVSVFCPFSVMIPPHGLRVKEKGVERWVTGTGSGRGQKVNQ